MKNKRVMVIGLDGATFDLIKPWADAGELPTFKKLMENGVWGELESTVPFATIPAWPSFATGCNPGKHGFYDFFKEKDGSYELTVEIYPSKAIKRPTLWEILSVYNKKVAVINVPATYPPKKVNGYVISGMLTPPGAKYTYPQEFEKELIQSIGRYNVFFSALSAKNPQILLEDLKETLEERIDALKYIWTNKKPNFLMMVDNGTDRSEHELWRFLDPENPLYNEEEVKKYGNPLLEYYKTVDKSLQQIIDMLDQNTVLFLMSDHGQGSLRKFVNLNMFLIEEGFMEIKKESKNKFRYLLFKHGFTPQNIYNLLRKIGLERYASDRISSKTRLKLLNKFFFSSSDIDWSKTMAFASGVTGSITINLKGRQPRGIVNKEEYEDIRSQLIQRLLKLRDPETNDKIVKNVYKREEIYHGPYLDKAPDLVAVPNNYYEFFGMHGFTFNKVVTPTFGNSGSHRPYGIFMAYGENIEKGKKVNGTNILDVTPTILHTMELPIPEHMDGKALEGIFEVTR